MENTPKREEFTPVPLPPPEKKGSRVGAFTKSAMKNSGTVLGFMIVIAIASLVGNVGTLAAIITLFPDAFPGDGTSTSKRITATECNIDVIPLHGIILPYAGADKDGVSVDLPPSTSATDVRYWMKEDEKDENVRGILVQVSSPGGYPTAGEDMMLLFKRSPLPVAALIRDTGASAAYLAATGADTIIASPFSDIGSIGITMSYLDNSEQNKKEGLQYISLTSGKFKDSGSSNKPLTEEERKLFDRDLKIYHEQFVKEVAENRKLPISDVSKLADGSSMPGSLALQNKLIDQLGDRETARTWFANKLALENSEIVFCDE